MPEYTPEEFARLVSLFIPETVSALAFSPDGTLLAVAAADKVHIYRVPKPKPAPSSPPTTGDGPAGG
ncbi:MAG TPA: hypothetical protein VKU00_01145 [Chthonomonadaceae bacterium]|nr:hypothetical protein [Chthonomonadaceae bacterium]